MGNNTATQIRQHRLGKAQRKANTAELEKALQLCLTCLNDIKPAIEYVGVLGYVDATILAAVAVITRGK